MIEGHAGGGDQHEVQSRRQSQVEMNAPDNAQDSAALQFNLEVAARQGTEFTVSYHIRNVPVLSTIEMSPGCGFTLPRKSGRVPLRKSLFSRDDSELEEGCDVGSGMGARGKGQRLFPRTAL